MLLEGATLVFVLANLGYSRHGIIRALSLKRNAIGHRQDYKSCNTVKQDL